MPMSNTMQTTTEQQPKEYDDKVREFQKLSIEYVKQAIFLLYQADSYELLPKQVTIMKDFIVEYIKNNKVLIINHSLQHHDEIINFTIEGFTGDDDEQTVRNYGGTVEQYNTADFNVMAMLLQIKRKSKKLTKEKHQKVKDTIGKLSNLLKNMQKLV
jgi:hypothetical protein